MIRLRRYSIHLLAMILVVAAAGPASGSGLEEDLQSVLDFFLVENPIAPGVSACVTCPGLGLDWSGASGLAAFGDTTALTPLHTFRIASNTKTYVAASVLRLAEKGLVRLDGSLRDHIDSSLDSLLESDGYDTKAITIAHVLSHTAGFADHTNDPRFEEMIFSRPDYHWTAGEQLRALVDWFDPLGPPGEKFSYSDSGYIILGRVIEGLTGKRLGPAVRDLLGFDRLGLEVTYWEYMEEAPPSAGPRAHQYYGDTDVTSYHASFDLYGGGGIVTDTRELASFMRSLLTGEVFEDGSTLERMVSGGTDPYRLGLMSLDCGGHEALGHQGFWNTFSYYFPSLDLTVAGCVLNHEATNGRELMCRLALAVLDEALLTK